MAMWTTLTGFAAPPLTVVAPVGKTDVLRHNLTVGRPWVAAIPSLASWTTWTRPPALLAVLHPLERLELAGLTQVMAAHIDEPAPGSEMHVTQLWQSLAATDRRQASNRVGMAVASLLAEVFLGAQPTKHVEDLIAAGLIIAARQHPDLVAWYPPASAWAVILEAKGYGQQAAGKARLEAAKNQALAVSGVGSPPAAPVLRAASVTLLGSRKSPIQPLRAHLHDPDFDERSPALVCDPDALLAEHYGFFARTLLAEIDSVDVLELGGEPFMMVELPALGRVGLHQHLWHAIGDAAGQGEGPMRFAASAREFLAGANELPSSRNADIGGQVSIGRDGIALLIDRSEAR